MELYNIKDYYNTREIEEEELEEIVSAIEEIELTDCDAEEELVKFWRKNIVNIDYFL